MEREGDKEIKDEPVDPGQPVYVVYPQQGRYYPLDYGTNTNMMRQPMHTFGMPPQVLQAVGSAGSAMALQGPIPISQNNNQSEVMPPPSFTYGQTNIYAPTMTQSLTSVIPLSGHPHENHLLHEHTIPSGMNMLTQPPPQLQASPPVSLPMCVYSQHGSSLATNFQMPNHQESQSQHQQNMDRHTPSSLCLLCEQPTPQVSAARAVHVRALLLISCYRLTRGDDSIATPAPDARRFSAKCCRSCRYWLESGIKKMELLAKSTNISVQDLLSSQSRYWSAVADERARCGQPVISEEDLQPILGIQPTHLDDPRPRNLRKPFIDFVKKQLNQELLTEFQTRFLAMTPPPQRRLESQIFTNEQSSGLSEFIHNEQSTHESPTINDGLAESNQVEEPVTDDYVAAHTSVAPLLAESVVPDTTLIAQADTSSFVAERDPRKFSTSGPTSVQCEGNQITAAMPPNTDYSVEDVNTSQGPSLR